MQQKFNPKNKDLIVNINGQLVHRDKAGVSPFDSVVQGGDAVWEGLRLYDGRIFKLHEHLDRMERSARALAIVDLPPREKIIEELKRTLTANKMRDGVHVRLLLVRGREQPEADPEGEQEADEQETAVDRGAAPAGAGEQEAGC